jgi:hypothetical protein
LHSAVLHLDDRNECVGDWVEFGDVFCVGHVLEREREVLEKVINVDVFRCDDESINIGVRTVDTQRVATKCEDPSTGIVYCRGGQVFGFASPADEFFDDFL